MTNQHGGTQSGKEHYVQRLNEMGMLPRKDPGRSSGNSSEKHVLCCPLQVKLMKYICKQLQCKQKVPDTERPGTLDSFPRLEDWLRTVNVRPELIQAVKVKLSLDALLQMPSSQVKETMRRLGSTSDDCARLCAALNCLRSASESGEFNEDSGCWFSEPMRRDSGGLTPVDQIPLLGGSQRPHSPSPLTRPTSISHHSRYILAPSDTHVYHGYAESLTDPSPYYSSRPIRLHGHTSTPPITPPSRRRHRLKPPCTPPPPSRKVLHLLPNITLTRSKSHESQLGHRIEDIPTNKCVKKNKLFLNVQINSNGCEDSATRSPTLSIRTPSAVPNPPTAPYTLPGTPTLQEEHVSLRNNVAIHRSSPQALRRDIGLAVTHRFSTKSWLSQTCQVCQKNMIFGVKCKHCRLKCHNKCTKEAPPCRISFLPITKIRRTESVPSDINNPVDRPPEAPQFGTLPKALTKKDQPPVLNQLDSSSNPSSTTSSTPSSPAPFQQSNPPSVTPPPNPSPKGHRDNRFHFPDVCGSSLLHSDGLPDTVNEIDPSLEEMHAEQDEEDDREDLEEEEEEELEAEEDENVALEEEDEDDEEELDEDEEDEEDDFYEEDMEDLIPGSEGDTIWYELQARDWPISSQPAEATIWQVGSGEGIRRLLGEINLGKEVTEILSACWSFESRSRPSFTQVADMLEKLPKLNRRLSHPGHFWKSAEYVT
ncbi:hypothetical protein DNTS_026126 [Danionella cerebrum]|uniref:Phorbol-ester/DAG-type domain-containing protein n=1 Tax=Danionella cerebrum TaxID=2873325 RepID=A0A553QQI7_9TELE|nr:hypothetical protein DNTS_026126 [Danionella translucida]